MKRQTKTIESIIKAIATSDKFSDFSFVLDTWMEADARLEHLNYPAIICITPTGGNTIIRNSKVYDTETVALAFLDTAPRQASGEENAEVYTRMKEYGAAFIRALNRTRLLEPITAATYSIICEKLATNVSGVVYSLTLTQTLGGCADE